MGNGVKNLTGAKPFAHGLLFDRGFGNAIWAFGPVESGRAVDYNTEDIGRAHVP